MSDDISTLDNYRLDRLLSLYKALAGMLPTIGPAVAEFASFVPGQRNDRIVAYLKILDEQFQNLRLEHSIIVEYFFKPGFHEIFEEACEQALRSNSEERRKYIAEVVIKGFQGDEIEKEHCQHFLGVLKQLTDSEVLVLISYWNIGTDFNRKFIAKHKKIVDPDANTKDVQFFESYTQHLSSFELLYKPPRVEWGGEFPADLSSHMSPNDNESPREELNCRITNLGETFLDYIGVTENI